jgi:hypothetical protein
VAQPNAPKLEACVSLTTHWLHKQGQAILTTKEALALAAELLEIANTAHQLGEPDVCVMLEVCEPHSESNWGNGQQRIYLSASVFNTAVAGDEEFESLLNRTL